MYYYENCSMWKVIFKKQWWKPYCNIMCLMDVPYSEHEGTELHNMDLVLHLNLYAEHRQWNMSVTFA